MSKSSETFMTDTQLQRDALYAASWTRLCCEIRGADETHSTHTSMRTLQEFTGHRDFKTILVYADYAPNAGEIDLVNRAFAPRMMPD
jgi:hypothetical protein